MIRVIIILCGVVLLLSLCFCAPQQNHTELALVPNVINDEEKEMLLTFYDSLPPQLSQRQLELVESYRALRAYLVNERPGVSFCVELLEPGSSLSPTGNSYDTFHILWPDASKGKYSVRKRQDGTLEIQNLGGTP